MKTLRPAQIYHDYRGASFIPLNIAGLPQTVDALGKTWYRKNEFHSTIIYVKRIARGLADAKGITEVAATELLWKAAQSAVQEFDDHTVTPTDELRYAQDEEQETIAMMVDVTNLEPLFDRMRSELDYAEIEIPPTHITLYTDPNGAMGVPLPTQSVLSEHTRLLEGDELTAVKQAIRFGSVLG